MVEHTALPAKLPGSPPPWLGGSRALVVLRVTAAFLAIELLMMWGVARAEIRTPWVLSFVDATILALVAWLCIFGWMIRSYVQVNHEVQAGVRASEQRWRFALESAGAGMWELDLRDCKVYYSPRCKAILGYADDEIANTVDEWRRRSHPDDLPLAEAQMQAYLAGGAEVYQVEQRLRAKDGSWKWVLDRGMAVERDSAGRPLRMIGTMADITARKCWEDELRALATTDPLTGLPNRRRFLARLDEAHALLQRLSDQCASVLMLDIDHFKCINDTHGHPVGDAVLRHLAALMSGELRKTDTVGRLGGEEFAVILIGADVDAAQAYAERLRSKVAASPYSKGQVRIPFTVSIGVAALDIGQADVEVAMGHADRALYAAKQAGRNCVRVDPASAAVHACGEIARPGFVKLVWRPAYECGVAEIDTEHRGLFDASNRLLNAMVANQSIESVAPLVESMLAGVVAHFQHEEDLLGETQYPGLADHRAQHRELARRASELVRRHRSGELTIGEVFGFLAYDVAASHLLREDRKYFGFLKARLPAAACLA